ncbi:MBL fold metallo-hydrolase [Bacillus lacus]|uniref:MBL fold metallo-hydrolase n=1 Tax=Metabacillus lacus TaxID=1983721 RepID=A0A7X2M0D9_9BACI|nr:MBL fold metallo-hydrolase [Metabacillus lacus]MRX72709.1 MBL fold metallo-hydrolase [Metabacillus lacus]
MEKLQIGNISVSWLDGGVTHLDGGAMFGVVPKALWTKKYHANENNLIELRTDPLLVQKGNLNILIETGIGKGKLTEKQRRNYGVSQESRLRESLQEKGLVYEDIHFIIMTHLHFDHASGLTAEENGMINSVFPNAKIVASDIEWNEMKNPNIRSRNTYWENNWSGIENQMVTFQESFEVTEGITVHHTGGHSDGHCVVVLEDSGESALHMADLMPTHAHWNPLWVLAFDDYPMTSIEQKQKWLSFAAERNSWFTFYHDAYYRAVKFGEKGHVAEYVERIR